MNDTTKISEESKRHFDEKITEALKRVRQKIEENPSKGSVQKRLEGFANASEAPEPVKTSDKKKDKMSAKDLAKRSNDHNRKIVEAKKKGIDINPKENDKDRKEKEEDKNKDKTMTPEKQEAKMKEMFSKIKLPSGMEIHQEGPQWVLVSKDGKQRTDVTDVMNTIDKFNRNIDAVNEENRVQNAAQSKADNVANNVGNDASRTDVMKDSGFKVNNTNDKALMIGEALPKVKDVNGEQVFKPEDIKTVAETALSFSDEKAKLEKLKDPKALEEMRKRENRNQQKADEAARIKAMRDAKTAQNGA